MTATTDQAIQAKLLTALEAEGATEGSLYVVIPVNELEHWSEAAMRRTVDSGGRHQPHRASCHLIQSLTSLGYVKRVEP